MKFGKCSKAVIHYCRRRIGIRTPQLLSRVWCPVGSHRTIASSPCKSIERWSDDTMASARCRVGAMALTRWCDGDEAMFESMRRCSNDAMERWCDGDEAIAWWCDGDGAMKTMKTSLHRYRTIASSQSHHRVIAITPSRHRHPIIAPSAYRAMKRWCDATKQDTIVFTILPFCTRYDARTPIESYANITNILGQFILLLNFSVLWLTHTRTYTHIYTYTHIHTHTYIYIHTHTRARAHTHTHNNTLAIHISHLWWKRKHSSN